MIQKKLAEEPRPEGCDAAERPVVETAPRVKRDYPDWRKFRPTFR